MSCRAVRCGLRSGDYNPQVAVGADFCVGRLRRGGESRGTATPAGGGLPVMGWLGIGVSSLGIAGPKGQHPLTVLLSSMFA